jgi:hypothetical protein
MSHLNTIIYRVVNRLEIVYNGDVERASKDSLWLQSIRNLDEYQRAWKDQSEEEVEQADLLYYKYAKYLT